MAISQLAVLAGNNGSSPETPTWPVGGVPSGKFAMLVVNANNTGTNASLTIPAGFTLWGGAPVDQGANQRSWFLYKTTTGAEAGAITVTVSDAARWEALGEVLDGVDPSTLQVQPQTNNASTTPTLPSITTTYANGAVRMRSCIRRAATPRGLVTWSSPWEQVVERSPDYAAGAVVGGAIARHTLVTSAGTYGGGTTALNPSSLSIFYAYALAPAASTPPVTGSAALTLPALAAAGAGTTRVTGTAAVSLPALTGSGAASTSVTGSAALTLPALTSEAAAATSVTGSAALTLPALTSEAAAATSVTGSAALTLPGLIASGGGQTGVIGQGEAALPMVTVNGDGQLLVSGNASITIPALTAEGAGDVGSTSTGAAALTLPSLAAVGTGQLRVSGTASVTLPHLTTAGAAATTVSAVGAVDLPPLAAAGEVSLTISGQADIELPSLLAEGEGFNGNRPFRDVTLTGVDYRSTTVTTEYRRQTRLRLDYRQTTVTIEERP